MTPEQIAGLNSLITAFGGGALSAIMLFAWWQERRERIALGNWFIRYLIVMRLTTPAASSGTPPLSAEKMMKLIDNDDPDDPDDLTTPLR